MADLCRYRAVVLPCGELGGRVEPPFISTATKSMASGFLCMPDLDLGKLIRVQSISASPAPMCLTVTCCVPRVPVTVRSVAVLQARDTWRSPSFGYQLQRSARLLHTAGSPERTPRKWKVPMAPSAGHVHFSLGSLLLWGWGLMGIP